MTLAELKKMIEKEVSAVLGGTMEEPSPEQSKPQPPKKIRAEVKEEDLDNFIFHGQSKANEDEENKPKKRF